MIFRDNQRRRGNSYCAHKLKYLQIMLLEDCIVMSECNPVHLSELVLNGDHKLFKHFKIRC
jgi:hypothetical protein